MIPRFVAIAVGALLLAAVTHVTVLSTGGYGTPHSFVAIAVAAGVGAGSVFCGMAWSQRRFVLCFGLAASVICGEAFGLFQTAQRLVAGSEATQAPLREHGKAHAKAKADVAKAEMALVKAGTSDRLDKAAAAKGKADKAVTGSAKEMGCRIHCRELLQKAVDDAAREVEAARKETEDNKAKAETALEKAQAALARMKAPVSPTPLADLTGAPAWVLDLTIAILGSIGVNGLACCLLIFGAHGAHQRFGGDGAPRAHHRHEAGQPT